MKKQFSKQLSVMMLFAMILTVLLIFVLQTYLARSDAKKTELVQIEQAITKMDSNNQSIAALKENLNTESISKTGAFALMIEQNPDILKDANELARIRDILNVDELHVTDEKGVLSWGTEPSMFGFDFNTNDQTKPFLEGIQNKSFQLAQEPQKNATNGVLFQYIGISRIDKPGIVQIGLQPGRLESALKNNEIATVLSGILVGKNGYIFAVDQSDGKILYHKDSTLIGKDAQESGVPLEDMASGFTKFSDGTVHYFTRLSGNVLLGAAMPISEVYSNRKMITLIFFISNAVIFLFLITMINRMLNKNVVTGLHNICTDLTRITGGDTGVTVSVRNNEEFGRLSDGINEMVGSIKHKMEESDSLVHHEMESFLKVKNVSQNIQGISNRMLAVSGSLTNGVQEQLEATNRLSESFNQVSGHINATAQKAQAARELSVMVGEKLVLGNREMKEMVASMAQISEHSNSIRNIIKNIEDISFQTNILALNSAVEAARAGVAGKGFSIVAQEVRNLASKTAQSAKDTATLIDSTLSAVQLGSDNAQQTAKSITDIMQDAEKSAQLVDSINQVAVQQALLVVDVEREMEHIASVVQSNSNTAQESEAAAEELSVQMQALEQHVRN